MSVLSLWGQYLGSFLRGLVVTIEITVVGLAVAVVVGAVLALLRSSGVSILRLVATAYIDVMRAVPVLVLLFIVYYGLGQVGLTLSGPTSAVLALGAFYAALFAEIFRGGVSSVDRGQQEAARALGMGGWLQVRRVIIPQAFLAILLPSTNEISNIIKDTSLVVTIGVGDLMSQAYQASASTFQPMDMFVLAGLVYLALYLVISRALGRWELSVQRRRS